MRRRTGPWERRAPTHAQSIRATRTRFRDATRKPPPRWGTVALAVVAFAVVILLGLAAPYLPSLARKAEYQMIRTIDGDTLELADGERVRVLNIDAPEMPPGSRCAAEEALALEARERLRELIKGADDITLRPGGDGRDRDRYGRLLRLIEIDGADAGNVLISEGLAQPWTGRHAEWC